MLLSTNLAGERDTDTTEELSGGTNIDDLERP